MVPLRWETHGITGRDQWAGSLVTLRAGMLLANPLSAGKNPIRLKPVWGIRNCSNSSNSGNSVIWNENSSKESMQLSNLSLE